MAKTTSKVTTVRETTCETYDNPDFSGVIRETVSFRQIDAEGKETSSSSRRVYPSEETGHADYCKALVLALARYGKLLDLPYTISGVSANSTDAEQWYVALTDDNSPGKVSFRRGKDGYAQFRELVLPLDFRVYDAAKADEIRAMYVTGSTVKVEVDADLMIQGELGELDEKQ